MKMTNIRKIFTYFVLGISISFIGILLIPLGILVLLISFIWTNTDKIIRLLGSKPGERSETNCVK